MIDATQTTFLDAFDPPEDLVGTCAIFVTMSADDVVLDAALSRFTRQTGRRRLRSGRCCAYLLRDLAAIDGSPRTFGPSDVPGLHELRAKPDAGGRTLHAKIVLLGFAERPDAPPTHARLVVSTGNFRRGSLRGLLDLVFVSETVLGADADLEALADLKAAAKFVRELGDARFQVAAELAAGDRNPLEAWSQLLDVLVAVRPRGAKPRFFHSLTTPLMPQLEERMESLEGESRNFILCASGFYEQLGEHAEPEVLARIAAWPGISPKVTRRLLVNPAVSGQLRDAHASVKAAGFSTPERATEPRPKPANERALHAKFILVGRARGEDRDLTVRSAHLYLGSGNLSKRGMLLGPRERGNIEAGVFVAVEGRLDGERLREALFWDPSARPIDDAEWNTLAPADGERHVARPCPLLHARVAADGIIHLVWAPGAHEGISVQLENGDTILVAPGGQVDRALAGSPGFAVCIQAVSDGTKWEVPVIGPSGRYGWDAPLIRSASELLDWIAEPALMDDLDDEDDDSGEDDSATKEDDSPVGRSTGGPRPRERRYPLLELARLVEGLARRFQGLEGSSIDSALDQLEWWSDVPLPTEIVDRWRGAPVVVTSHLRNPAIAPAGMRAKQRERYDRVLTRLQNHWGLR